MARPPATVAGGAHSKGAPCAAGACGGILIGVSELVAPYLSYPSPWQFCKRWGADDGHLLMVADLAAASGASERDAAVAMACNAERLGGGGGHRGHADGGERAAAAQQHGAAIGARVHAQTLQRHHLLRSEQQRPVVPSPAAVTYVRAGPRLAGAQEAGHSRHGRGRTQQLRWEHHIQQLAHHRREKTSPPPQ
jgi:hypothetical protein